MKTNPSKALRSALLSFLYYSGLYYITDKLFSPKGLYIVGYHRIERNLPPSDVHVLAVTQQNLEAHFRYYKRSYEVISMDEAKRLLEGKSKWTKRYMVITFDDGYRDNYTLGAALFEQYQIPATIYLTVGPIENREPLWTDMVDEMIASSRKTSITLLWDGLQGTFSIAETGSRIEIAERIKNEIKRYNEEVKQWLLEQLRLECGVERPTNGNLMLDWQEARSLVDLQVNLGGHTMSHPTLSTISPLDASLELVQSKKLIETKTSSSVRHFAYPYGLYTDFNESVRDEAARHYDTAVTAVNGINGIDSNHWELNRVIVENISVRKLQYRFLKLKIQYQVRHWLRLNRR
ncbi:polysaccharide deacetylase family protein [Paenibacillus sp. R14(2021)]|uniref:polysaccharide deacetylase family protein n=1 Tax=Paenibacillus sp. R14(2021) TaxID=2859228 RepID=UPI001C612DB3|nr:polysaccharide deacetylase family protein [Paenibacillus sp. R14(2021)]